MPICSNRLILTLKSLLVKSTPRTNGKTPVFAIVFFYFPTLSIERQYSEMGTNRMSAMARILTTENKNRLLFSHTAASLTAHDMRSEMRNKQNKFND